MRHDASPAQRRYPRVADALTLYAWRVPAVRLSQWAEAAGVPAAAFAAAEVLLSLLVFASFWRGHYWPGLLAAVAVMIVSVAGPAANARERRLRHAVATLFPLLWYWAWEHGLAAHGRPFHPVYATMVLWVVAGGTIAINVIEALAVARFNGMEIHAWRPFDSRFRLVSASRNINLLILALSLLAASPDSGFIAVAWWTLISLIVHAVRLAQLTERQARRLKVESWLDQ